MNVLISGARGFIGGRLARVLKKSGCRVLGISRSGKSRTGFDAIYRGYLLDPLPGLFSKERIDAFIHCAYHRGRDDYKTNVDGTILWAEQAAENGVPVQIFLTSLSAQRESLSSYGQAKHALENWFVRHNNHVLRLGLVAGGGGLFQKVIHLVRKNILLPLPNGGRSQVLLTGIGPLCSAIDEIIMKRIELQEGRVWNFFQPEPWALKDILAEIRRQAGTACLFLPIPSSILLKTAALLEKFPFLKIGISPNNIIGLGQNSELGFVSDYEHFGLPVISLASLIREALQND